MNKELKPCPFCGGRAEKEWGIPSIFWIKCTGCGVEGSQHGSLEEAIKAWNTRKPIDEVMERLEEERDRPFADCNLTINGIPANDREIVACKVGIKYAIEIVKGGGKHDD